MNKIRFPIENPTYQLLLLLSGLAGLIAFAWWFGSEISQMSRVDAIPEPAKPMAVTATGGIGPPIPTELTPTGVSTWTLTPRPTTTPQPTLVATPTPEFVEYIVRPGDTLLNVARTRCGSAGMLDEIRQLNLWLKSGNWIRPGQQLILPASCN